MNNSNAKENLKSNIIMNIRFYIQDDETLNIIESIITKELSRYTIDDMETLPATTLDYNAYIWNIYIGKRKSKLSDKTIKAYETTLKELIAYVDKPFNQIDQNDIEYYLDQKRRLGCNPVTLNNEKSNINAFFGWLYKNKYIPENPASAIEPYPVIHKQIDHLETVEFDTLRSFCKNNRDRTLIEFLRCSACRVGELLEIKISDIDFKSGKVYIYAPKTKEVRMIMIDDICQKYLKAYIEERGLNEKSHEPLFAKAKGDKTKPMSDDSVRLAINNIKVRANMDRRVYPHLFRKSTATEIVKRSGSDEMAGAYLGHKPKSVTGQHYTFKGENYIEEIFNKCVRQ